MEKQMTIQVQIFGAFRSLIPSGMIKIGITPKSTVGDLKTELVRLFKTFDENDPISVLVLQSVIADETRILGENEEIKGGMNLAILPPVCGG